jgi:hypothetical protein
MDPGLLRTIREEWPVVRTAPWSFAIIAVVAAGIGFGAATLWWSGTVSTLREHLAFSQDKLQTALSHPTNPAAALITKPEENGRRVSAQEKQCLISKFKDLNKDFIGVVVTAFPSDEAQKYATDFSNIFLRMGYLSGVIQGSPKSYDDTGVIVGFRDPDKPSDNGKRFKEILSTCIKLNDRSLRWDVPPSLAPQMASVDFDLFIGPTD